MGKFNFEDYRQPFETGPHWELKREFMEKYCDMFSEERLLCLAQAYSNIVLMNCSYPDPVMRQINELSRPLKMRKKFQQSNDYSEPESSEKQQKNVSDKAHAIYEKSGKSFKEIKFCQSNEVKECTAISSNPVKTEKVPTNNTSASINMSALQNPNAAISPAKNNNQGKSSIPNSIDNTEINPEYLHILSTLGLEFIQKLVQQIRKYQVKFKTPICSLLNAMNDLKIPKMLSFKIEADPKSPHNAREFVSELRIKNCLVAVGRNTSKKKARFVSADSAVDILISLSQASHVSKIQTDENDTNKSLSKRSIDEINCTSDQAKDCIKKQRIDLATKEVEMQNSDQKSDEQMKLLQHFSNRMCELKRREHPVTTIKKAAKSLMMLNYISFKSADIKQCTCNFSFNHILISSGKGPNFKFARERAAESAFDKFMNLSEYKIQNGELKKSGTVPIDKPLTENIESVTEDTKPFNLVTEDTKSVNRVTADTKPVNRVTEDTNSHAPFVLNRTLFDNSVEKGFVLLNNFDVFSLCYKNTRAVLSDSASFCHKAFGYNVEDMPSDNSFRASVLIDNEVVGTAVATKQGDAKSAACHNAFESLKKVYYGLKMKHEYIDGFIITRDQVCTGESFENAPLSESNKGCMMLKNMGWTGGGLKPSGISEPIQVGNVSFGRGLGWGNGQAKKTPGGGKTTNKGDVWKFRKNIQAMLEEYSRSNSMNDLIFAKDFQKNERKEIHQIAVKFDLHTASRGKNEDRFLTVRRKYSVPEILNHLLSVGGSNRKFQLVDYSNITLKFVC